MRNRFGGAILSVLVTAVLAAVAVTATFRIGEQPVAGQARAYRAPRTPDGKPDLNGIWQTLNTANLDLQEHKAQPSPIVAMGTRGAIPAGIGVVEGGEIPYRPEAMAKKVENQKNSLASDPTVRCYLPGVPRATYMPYPFQIVQGPDQILLAYEFANASRVVYMNTKPQATFDTWMGWSNGHWEGDTLVVDVTSFNDQTWFDNAGNYHSDALHVVERYTATGPDHLMYEATIEDPTVFTRPWKIRMPLYRLIEERAQIFQFNCVEFVEELVYGHLRKKPAP